MSKNLSPYFRFHIRRRCDSAMERVGSKGCGVCGTWIQKPSWVTVEKSERPADIINYQQNDEEVRYAMCDLCSCCSDFRNIANVVRDVRDQRLRNHFVSLMGGMLHMLRTIVEDRI